jgi:homeobox-leucine zipper protein
MELALSLGDTPKPFSLFENPNKSFSIVLEQAKKSLDEKRGSSDPPIQLNLLPSTPVPRSHPSPHQIPWLNDARKHPLYSFIYITFFFYRQMLVINCFLR